MKKGWCSKWWALEIRHCILSSDLPQRTTGGHKQNKHFTTIPKQDSLPLFTQANTWKRSRLLFIPIWKCISEAGFTDKADSITPVQDKVPETHTTKKGICFSLVPYLPRACHYDPRSKLLQCLPFYASLQSTIAVYRQLKERLQDCRSITLNYFG